MRWLTNTYDPGREGAKFSVIDHIHSPPGSGREMHKEWLKGKIIGPPKATEAYTVEQLKDMNMVGVYLPLEE